MHRAVVLMLATVVTMLAVLLLAGHGPWSGSTIVELSDKHGLNTGDLPVLALWAVGLACCAWLWRRAEH